MNKTILVTGVAGFIGFHLAKALLHLGYNVIGIDNINNYYDVNLKYARLNALGIEKSNAEQDLKICDSKTFNKRMQFIKMDLIDREALSKLFTTQKIDIVCNLAAQPGVRYSIKKPEAYVDSNIVGFLNVLECCRNYNISKLVFASSSSVYGNSDKVPFKESQNVDHPISIYAATKKSNELMAHCYSHLYDFETIGLRFFTVYGPWGRPDMAMFLFTDAIINDEPIQVFNNGNLSRDFTYIDDIISGIVATLINDSKNKSKYKLYNIGNSKPIKLLNYIEEIENALNKKAIKTMMPMQAGDVNQTFADVSQLKKDFGYKPNTPLSKGVKEFVVWYKSYYNY